MKILLIANYIPDGQQSMQRFANLLEAGLLQAGHEVRVIRPVPRFGALKPSNTGLGKWLGYIDKFLIFPAELQRALAWADVVHICDHSNSFYVNGLQSVPHLVTCNDMLGIRSALGEIPENQTGWTGQQLQRMILNGLNRAQRVACISEQTREELLRISSLKPETVTRIYMGLNYPYAPMTAAIARNRITRLGVPSHARFILHVGGNQWYKNRAGVLEIYRALRSRLVSSEGSQLKEPESLYLVMAGRPLPPHLQEWIETHGLSPWVIKLQDVDNEDLRALYSTATALLFPSLQEGFGWPIAEAQACGCPVFTSNRPPMTEVGGKAAIYINPEAIEEAADKIAHYLPDIRNFTHLGLENAQQFSPEAMIHAYLREYEQVIEEKNG